jgi:CheY-like chemotaxis protein
LYLKSSMPKTKTGPLSVSASLPERHRIFLIDDHSIMREGLRRLLEAESELSVSGEASTAKQALAAIAADQPDLCSSTLHCRAPTAWS